MPLKSDEFEVAERTPCSPVKGYEKGALSEEVGARDFFPGSVLEVEGGEGLAYLGGLIGVIGAYEVCCGAFDDS